MDHPAAFLSHSSKDREMAHRLAKNLREQGVDVWYAEWEIKPGDSLRQKIDEGIDRASHFLVLLTPNSLDSEWVKTELDAGMVKRIEGSCRLIPVLQGIENNQVPITLRGLLWVKLDPYEAGLRKLVEACHEVATKPPLGPVPHWAQQRPLQGSTLSVHAQRLAALLSERSEAGLSLDPQLNAEAVLQTLAITGDEAAVAADELEEHGMVKLHKHAGMGNVGFGRISPTPELFFVTDPHLKGWNPANDARVLAAVLVNEGKDIVSLAEADKVLSWGPRRLNPAAYFLSLHSYAQPLKQLFSVPYAYGGLIISAKTRRFATET